MKLHAPDQDRQCYDYYTYVKENKDSQTLIYYLTLDGHMPNDESRNGLREDEELKPISFGKEIMEWLGKCLEYVQQCTVMKTMIEQFMDNINRLTGNEGENLAMELITDFETFKAADNIAESVSKIKTEKMKEIFEKIKNTLEDRGYEPIEENDYKVKADKYYNQSASTYPGLNYDLDQESSLVLRIEIDHNLYMGICQWDKEKNCILQKLKSNEKVDEMRVKDYLESESNSYYGWTYLPAGRNINFKDFSGLYAELFNGDESIINEICDQVEEILRMWKVSEKDKGTIGEESMQINRTIFGIILDELKNMVLAPCSIGD